MLVIGGGITGVGVALDAATRGLRTALVERDDFASGTSSKSSKLVHGGLRYLQQGEVRLVYEALHERQRLRRNAPHLVTVLPFMIPILTKDGVVSRKIARAARLGDVDVRPHRRLADRQVPPAAEGRRGVRAPADDAARAAALGATSTTTPRPTTPACASPSPAPRPPRRGGRQPLRGRRRSRTDAHGRRRPAPIVAADGRRFTSARAGRRQRRRRVGRRRAGARRGRPPGLDPPGQGRARHRAVGEGAQRHRRRDPGAEGQAQPVRRARGAPIADGTFSTPTSAPPTPTTTVRLDDPQCTADDIDYVLRALNAVRHHGHHRRRRHRRVGRPAAAGQDGPTAAERTADLSRRHRSAQRPAGVISVAGGKLTTYREMAEDTVDAVVDAARPVARPGAAPSGCRLLGADGFREPAPAGAPAAHLAERFGTRGRPTSRAPRRRRPVARRAARRRASRTCAPRPLRRAPRDGHHARRRAQPAHPRPPVRPRRNGCRRPRRPSPRCSPPSSAGTRPRPPARSTTSVARCAAERDAGGRSEPDARSHPAADAP